MPTQADRLDRRQKYLEDLTYALTRMRLMPSIANISKQPVAKRKAGKPAAWMTHPLAANVTFADRSLEGRGGNLIVRIYTPPSLSSDQPALLYIHGGGWVVGGLDSCHWLCSELAARLETVVVSVDYRLAPEDPFPAALEDCQDALSWLLKNGAELGVDAHRIVVGGDSAGGNLAAALAYWDAQNERRLAQQLLIYPALDLSMGSPSHGERRSRLLTAESLAQCVRHYVGPNGDVEDPLVSPLLARSLKGLPPAIILTAQHDPLCDDGKRYADRLPEAGVPVEHRNYRTMGHGFFSTPRLCQESSQAMNDLIRLARAQLSLA